MLSLILPLVILLALVVLAMLALMWMLLSQTRRAAQSQVTTLQQTLSATTMTLVAQAEEQRKTLVEVTGKTLGATNALAEKTLSGISSIAAQQAKTTDSLIPLLAAKEPMAYSQLRQTDVALSPEQGTGPYPAADDAEWHRIETEAEKADREQAAQVEAQGRKWLEDQGVNLDAAGFPAVDQGQ